MQETRVTAACGFANEGAFFMRIPAENGPSCAKPQAAVGRLRAIVLAADGLSGISV
jgi:hypothetical protein